MKGERNYEKPNKAGVKRVFVDKNVDNYDR